MECLIDDVLRIFPKEGSLLDALHWFKSRGSCQANLIGAMERYSATVHIGVHLDAISADYHKAFDWVSHSPLLECLRQIRLNDTLITCVLHYVGSKNYRAGKRDSFQYLQQLERGTTGVHVPNIFSIFMNCLFLQANSLFVIYIDKVKVFREARTTLDFQTLQTIRSRLYRFLVASSLLWRIGKRETVRIDRLNVSG